MVVSVLDDSCCVEVEVSAALCDSASFAQPASIGGAKASAMSVRFMSDTYQTGRTGLDCARIRGTRGHRRRAIEDRKNRRGVRACVVLSRAQPQLSNIVWLFGRRSVGELTNF